MTKIEFKKWRLYSNLLLGTFWVILGALDFIISDGLDIFKYIYIALGVFYLFHFFYDLKHQYLILDNQYIQKNFLYGGWNDKIKLEDIIAIKKTNLNYSLKTEFSQLKINADLIDDDSYAKLKTILSDLRLTDDKKPALL